MFFCKHLIYCSVHVSVKERLLIPYSKDDSLFQSFQRLHVPWNLGSELFFCRMKAFLLTQLYANRFVSASLQFLRNFGVKSLPLGLLCMMRESKEEEKTGSANSRVSEAREKRVWNPVSHSVPFANLNPMKTRNLAPACNINSRFPPQFWAQIPNITAKKCRIPHPAKPIRDP